MSDKTFTENFWAEIERDGGFKLGEMFVMAARSGEGKTRFTEELVSDHAMKNDLPLAFYNLEGTHRFRDDTEEHVQEVRVLKERTRDYNGEQLTFNFNAKLTDD